MNRFVTLTVAALLGAAGSASAGSWIAASTQSIFGATYGVNTYNVRNDLRAANPVAGPDLNPEGMVFYNGVLYVSADSPANESNGYIAAYANGNIASTPSAIGQFSVVDNSGAAPVTRLVGPEGLAINTRGVGYGSFSGSAPKFVGVDNVGGAFGRPIFTMDSGTNSVGDIVGPVAGVPNSFVNGDDVVFIRGAASNGSQDRFAVLLDTGAAPSGGNNGATAANAVAFFSADGNFVSGTTYNEVSPRIQFASNLGAKGMTYLPAADALLFSPLATGDSLLISFTPTNGTNTLGLYSLDGTLIASSSISTLAPGLLSSIEALAFDSATKTLFMGDENGRSISTLTIPAPGAAGLLALGGLVARRRRR